MEHMTFEEAVKSVEGITLEQIWAILQDDRRKLEEKLAAEEKKRKAEEKKRKEEEKKRKEEQKEADEKWKAELARSNEEFKKNLEKAVGNLGNSIGDLTETIFSGSLRDKFVKHGYVFTAQNQDRVFYDESGKRLCEVDIWLENGDCVMAVEIKTKPDKAGIDKQIERLRKIRSHMDRTGNKRKLLGAVAGGILKPHLLRYIYENGLFVIVQSGETVEITVPDGFKAREW